jgi:hypothetical protein
MNTSSQGSLAYDWHFPVSPEETYSALSASIKELFKLKDDDEFTKTVQFETKPTMSQNGARCIAQVFKDENGSVVKLTATPKVVTQIRALPKASEALQELPKAISKVLQGK